MKRLVLLLSLMSLGSVVVMAEDQTNITSSDNRQLVEMPLETQQFLRQRMQSNLDSLSQIIAAFTAKDWETVASVAENNLAQGGMGRGSGMGMMGMGPGRYMPVSMRQLGMSMHAAAAELSIAAKQGDEQAAGQALQKLTNACVACHLNYRIR